MIRKKIGSVRSYSIGYVLSIVLTLGAYIPVVLFQNSHDTFFSQGLLIALVISLAVMQLFVQLIFFLHIGHESSPRWNLVFLVSTVSIILLVVLGSLWIMYHLNYNMMPRNMDTFIQKDELIHK